MRKTKIPGLCTSGIYHDAEPCVREPTYYPRDTVEMQYIHWWFPAVPMEWTLAPTTQCRASLGPQKTITKPPTANFLIEGFKSLFQWME